MLAGTTVGLAETPPANQELKPVMLPKPETDGGKSVVDLSRYDTGPSQPDRSIGNPDVQKSYYYVDTGLIAANVYLFAASQGLAAWFHNCNKDVTAKEFKLRPDQKVLFAQTVGYAA